MQKIVSTVYKKSYNIEVMEGEGGERIDKYIASKIDTQTRSQVQYLILNSKVFVNNSIERNCARKTKYGDSIALNITSTPSTLKPYHLDLDIVYEDDDLIVINKPPGLTIHPGTNTQNNTLANALIAYCKNLSSIAGEVRPGIVHRLDKDTSGLILVAKNNEVHAYLSDQIAQKKVERKYLALTYGVPNPIIGTITTNILPDRKDPTKMQVVNNTTGKVAITKYRVLKVFENGMFSLVECKLQTGRTHQIRVQMKYKNTPIVGDQKYASYYNFNAKIVSHKIIEAINLLNRQALHAYQIMFIHPKTQQTLKFQIPMEEKIQKLIDLLTYCNDSEKSCINATISSSFYSSYSE